MKSEHRHELKTNELATWILNLPNWAKENIKTIIYVAVLIVVVAGLTIYKSYYKNVVKVSREVEFTQKIGQLPGLKAQIVDAQSKNQDMSIQLLPYANTTLSDLATNNKLSDALALIKRGEALRSELHYRPKEASQSEVSTAINKAKDLYTQAVQLAGNDPSIKADAKFGIGLCQEELGDLQNAKQIYTEISTDKQFAGTITAALAKDRLAVMDDFQKPVNFKPAAQVVIPQPQLQTKPVDINVPAAPNLVNEPNSQPKK